MKLLRPIAIAVVLVGGFFYFTTYRSGTFRTINSPAAKVEITEAASNNPLDADEQNNIFVYHKNIGSVVNVTSKAVAFDFFYGLVPQEGQGPLAGAGVEARPDLRVEERAAHRRQDLREGRDQAAAAAGEREAK